MSDAYVEICMTREQAHQACLRAYAVAQALLASGENALVECKPALEPVSVKLRRFYHGPVLGHVSEQARVDGVRFTIPIWKEFYRVRFLPDEWEVVRMPGKKRATPRRVRSSTETLGNKAYAAHVDKVIDHATTELGVLFEFSNEEGALLRRKPETA